MHIVNLLHPCFLFFAPDPTPPPEWLRCVLTLRNTCIGVSMSGVNLIRAVSKFREWSEPRLGAKSDWTLPDIFFVHSFTRELKRRSLLLLLMALRLALRISFARSSLSKHRRNLLQNIDHHSSVNLSILRMPMSRLQTTWILAGDKDKL